MKWTTKRIILIIFVDRCWLLDSTKSTTSSNNNFTGLYVRQSDWNWKKYMCLLAHVTCQVPSGFYLFLKVCQRRRRSISKSHSIKMNNCDESAAKNLLSPVLVLAREFNNFFLNKLNLEGDKFKRLVIDGYQVGLVPNQILTELEKHYPQVFHIYPDAVELSPSYGDYDSRSNIVSKILQDFRKKETFVTLKGWRDECYEVKCGFDDPPLLKMERSATCLFGIRQYGVSINGCVRHPTKGLCLWLQKRSSTKQTWPGRLDNMVGGGLAVGYSVIETALKEAKEEASIPPNLLKNLKAAGTVSFYFESERGLFPNTEFVYDLELPMDFQPENEDGEVESFQLVTAAEAKDICLSAEFKTTSCPVTLDFLVRHSIINSHNEPDLPQLLELLHVPLHSIYKRIN